MSPWRPLNNESGCQIHGSCKFRRLCVMMSEATDEQATHRHCMDVNRATAGVGVHQGTFPSPYVTSTSTKAANKTSIASSRARKVCFLRNGTGIPKHVLWTQLDNDPGEPGKNPHVTKELILTFRNLIRRFTGWEIQPSFTSGNL